MLSAVGKDSGWADCAVWAENTPSGASAPSTLTCGQQHEAGAALGQSRSPC